jgi:hypothetical protein
MVLKYILMVVLFWWGFRLARVLLSGPRQNRRPQTPPTAASPEQDLSHLTQQEISDADFEEIPEK